MSARCTHLILALAGVTLFSTPSSRGEYDLTSPPPDWQKILETKRSFEGTAPLQDFLQFIFKDTKANFSTEWRSKSEFQISTSFRDRTLKDILETISQGSTVRVAWGYGERSTSPHRIVISAGPIDLMNKEIDISRYPRLFTLRPDFGRQ